MRHRKFDTKALTLPWPVVENYGKGIFILKFYYASEAL